MKEIVKGIYVSEDWKTKKPYICTTFGATCVSVKRERGPEEHLRKDCENEPIIYISPYKQGICPHQRYILEISGEDVKKLKAIIDWAVQ